MSILYIIMAVFGVLIVALLLWSIVWSIQERRLPVEEKMERVRAELCRRESPTGSTDISRAYVAGVSDEMIRDIADREGFDYVGAGNRFLNFQRRPAAE